jgi:outer membrane lipoprotein-sorting protein
MMKQFLILLFIVLFISFDGQSKESSFLPKAFVAKFEKSFKSIVTQKEVKSAGELSYENPSKIKLMSPDNTQFVSNGKKAWKYDPPFIEGEKGEVVIGPAKRFELVDLLDSLQAGLNSNKLYKVETRENITELVMSKAGQEQMQVSKVILEGVKAVTKFSEIKKMRLFDLKNQEVIYSFISFDDQVQFKHDSFNFEVPKDTNIQLVK